MAGDWFVIPGKIIFQTAEVAVSQGLMRKILDRIAALVPVPSG